MDFKALQSADQVQTFPALHHYQKQAERHCLQQLIQAALREQWVTCVAHGEGEWVLPFWRSRALVFLRGGKGYSLSRFSAFATIEILNHESGELRPLVDVQMLLALLCAESGTSLADPRWRLLLDELNNGIFNNAMSLAHREQWNASLAVQAQASGADNFWDWLRGPAQINDLPLFFEQWGAVGHPYHPCSKTKLGLSPAEVLEFSPEFEGGVGIRLLAVARQLMHVQQGDQVTDSAEAWLREQYPLWLAQWDAALEAAGLSSAEYAPLPVHAWQLKNEIKSRFATEITNGQIALVEQAPELAAGATMSFRTMAPRHDARVPHIKLPVAVQATSAVRTVSPASVQTGPQVSQALAWVCEQNRTIGESLTLLPESVGMHIRRDAAQTDDMRFLSALFRASPSSVINEGETALAVAALFADSPITAEPLLGELLSSAGVVDAQGVCDYLADYARCVLQGHLDLFLLYGVALEAHQQNALAVFDQSSRLCRMLARDFGGVRIHAPTLSASGYDIRPYPGAVTVTDDAGEVRNKFLHAVMQGHLGEVVLCLHRLSDVPEAQLWSVIADQVAARFEALRDQMEPQRWARERAGILEQTWQLKALMRMRLDETSHHYIYVDLANPLASAKHGK